MTSTSANSVFYFLLSLQIDSTGDLKASLGIFLGFGVFLDVCVYLLMFFVVDDLQNVVPFCSPVLLDLFIFVPSTCLKSDLSKPPQPIGVRS